MSCSSSADELLSSGTSSTSNTQSPTNNTQQQQQHQPLITPVKNAKSAVASSSSTAPVSKIVHAGGTQLIITTLPPSNNTHTNQTQKIATTQRVVSVAPVTQTNVATSTNGSSTTSGSSTSSNISPGSTYQQLQSTSSYQSFQTDTNQQQQTYTNMTNAFYQTQQTSNVSNEQTQGTPQNGTNGQQQQQQQQAAPVYYMYPEQSFDMDNQSYQDLEGHVSHTAQAAPITVQWLVDNFEPAEGCSLRRSSLYNFYIHHCNDQKLEPVNPASFGKLIRSVFLGLRTRRLGTRGNSKYHYYGIRVKATSPLNSIPEDHSFAVRHHPVSNNGASGSSSGGSTSNGPSSKRAKHAHNFFDYDSKSSSASQQQAPTILTTSPAPTQVVNATTIASSVTNNGALQQNQWSNENHHHHHQQQQQQSSQAQVVHTTTDTNGQKIDEDFEALVKIPLNETFKSTLPNFGTIKMDANMMLVNNLTVDDLRKFEQLYKEHCESILDLVSSLKFPFIDNVWQKFWRSQQATHHISDHTHDYNEYEDQVASGKFFDLCTQQEVLDFVRLFDNQFYQYCVDTLIPDVLHVMPNQISQQIRNFSKNAESWMRASLVFIPQEMKAIKLSGVKSLSMLLRRYTTLNHLAHAGSALLQNPDQIHQMSNDLSRIDFNFVQEQAGWICGCDNELVRRYEAEFKKKLLELLPLEDWAFWLDSIMTMAIQKYEKTDVYVDKIKNFLKNWALYCETVVRDLTLRSAPSFGSFHLIRLLYDEYMFYLAQHRIAKETGQTIISIMSESHTIRTEF